jgi:hypothetical protein
VTIITAVCYTCAEGPGVLKFATIADIARAGSKLAPEDSQQLVQQGGAVLLKGDEIQYMHKDTGPLMFVDVEALSQAVRACSAREGTVQAQ